jgi:hypothetical protein
MTIHITVTLQVLYALPNSSEAFMLFSLQMTNSPSFRISCTLHGSTDLTDHIILVVLLFLELLDFLDQLFTFIDSSSFRKLFSFFHPAINKSV